MAAGTNAKIATVRVTSFGITSVVTPGAAQNWRWTNFVSESVNHTIEELLEQSIYGYSDEPPSHRGIEMGEGDIEFEPNPNAIGQFARGVFGTHTTSVLCAPTSTGTNSGPFAGSQVTRHTFTPRAAPFSDRCELDPYQLMIYRGVGSAYVFLDTVFNSMEYMIEAGQLAKSTVGVMARRVVLNDQFQVASLVSSGGRPWVWDMCSFQIGTSASSLAGTDYFESITGRLETPIEGVPLLNGERNVGEMVKNGFRQTRFSGTLSFRDLSEYEAFRAYENRFLRMTFTNVNSNLILGNPSSAFYNTLQLEVPLFKTTVYNVNVAGPNRITADFEGRGEYSDGLGYSQRLVLINNVSSY